MAGFPHKYLMANYAEFSTGYIHKEIPTLCLVYGVDTTGTAYLGHWIEGTTFYNMLFPAQHTRELTQLEWRRYRQLIHILEKERENVF